MGRTSRSELASLLSWEGRFTKAYFSCWLFAIPAFGDSSTCGKSCLIWLAELALLNFCRSCLTGCSYCAAGSAYFKLFRFLGTMMVLSKLHLLVCPLLWFCSSLAGVFRKTVG